MNELAKELNGTLEKSSPAILSMLSDYGKRIYFPKGIISQTAEAKEKATKFNATIGIAKDKNGPLFLDSIQKLFSPELTPSDLYPYAPSPGRQDLRQLWAQRQRSLNPLLKEASLSLPVVTSGLTHGLSLIGDLFLNSGDTILTPDKIWGNYKLMWSVKSGATFETFPLYNEDLGFNLKGLENKLKEREGQKTLLVLNFPNNPTGYSPSKEEALAIKEILKNACEKGSTLTVLCDDAYFGMNYEENCFPEGLFGLLCDLHQNLLAVKIDGPTKELFVWGFRVGFLTFGIKEGTKEAYEALSKKVGGAIRGGISNVTHVGQTLLLKALQDEKLEDHIQEKVKILKERYREVKKNASLEKYTNLWEAYPYNSGYFMCLKLKEVSAENLRVHLLEKYNIGTIALGKHDLRIAFSSLSKSDIKEFFECLASAVFDLKK
ncbi:MAG: hypothetical protein CME68_03505 [Halobacteriovoraceae bacterium]|nr:hypothetical protein [Halobacteriovoraceae bacterium]